MEASGKQGSLDYAGMPPRNQFSRLLQFQEGHGRSEGRRTGHAPDGHLQLQNRSYAEGATRSGEIARKRGLER